MTSLGPFTEKVSFTFPYSDPVTSFLGMKFSDRVGMKFAVGGGIIPLSKTANCFTVTGVRGEFIGPDIGIF